MNSKRYVPKEISDNRRYMDYLESKKTIEEDEEEIISEEFEELKMRFEFLRREVKKQK